MQSLTAHTPAIAFAGSELVAKGPLSEVAAAAKALVDARDPRPLLLFHAETSQPVEIDFRGSVADVVGRLPQPDTEDEEAAASHPARGSEPAAAAIVPRGPGRPKLGVVPPEVTPLPRHWEWLASQPGSASVTLRKLVEAARRENAEADRLREARDATYRFMLAVAGDEAGFEEATRSLYGDDRTSFEALVENWPEGIRDHVLELADSAFTESH